MSACIKCGFENTGAVQVAGNVEYKDKCYAYGKCGWEDRDVEEHLHVSCPNCGYVTAEPCRDYAEQKAKFVVRPEAQPVTPVRQFQPSLYGGHGTRVQSAWDTSDTFITG